MTRQTLLFTGGGGAGSEAFGRLLAHRYDVHFADADIAAKPQAIHHSAWHQIPFAADPRFIDRLRSLCAALRVDLLIPGVDEELLLIAAERDLLPCDVLLPPREFVADHLDKLRSSQVLGSAGVAVPRTERLSARDSISFPCIVKPRSGRGSRGVATVNSEEELHAHVLLSGHHADAFVVQELLRGQEFTVTLASDRSGRLHAIVPVKVHVKRGITLRGETESDSEVIAACAAIHETAPVAGCINIQLIRTAAGVVMPFEVNPRISTTACLAVAAGADIFDIYLAGAGRPTPTERQVPMFQSSVGLKRSWHNEFIGRQPEA